MRLIFADDRLARLAESERTAYVTNAPFPHVVIDDFLPPDVAETIAERFPAPTALFWKRFDAAHELKLAFNDETGVDEYIRDVLYQFNSARFLQFLEQLTGCERLLPDPYFEGGGLHQIERGGFLDVHADFNYHSRLGLRRRLNVLVYFNRDWKEEYGGHLELWTRDMTTCVKRVLPVFNRCTIFSTTDEAYHGHPLPLACPPDMARRSIALYYYTADAAVDSAAVDRHSTLFQTRPGDETSAKYSPARRRRRQAKQAMLMLTPPVVLHAYEWLRRARKSHR